MDQINQQCLVLIKPDAMQRNLVGEIIARFERTGLKLVNCKIVQVTKELAEAHYPVTDEWLNKVGNNTLNDCEKYGVDVKKTLGTDEAIEIGKLVHSWNVNFLISSPIMAIIFEGVHAVEAIRKICGPTLPLLAPAGTIRGDFSTSSALSSNMHKQPILNLVHASGDIEEAKREIELWF
jgi:nucleoside-diphosphate kinase